MFDLTEESAKQIAEILQKNQSGIVVIGVESQTVLHTGNCPCAVLAANGFRPDSRCLGVMLFSSQGQVWMTWKEYIESIDYASYGIF